jgi:hypothetical protein
VGEIGISRREFLYEVKFWEVRRIIAGYRKRDRIKLQLLAECAYASLYAMRDPRGKSPIDLFPGIFDEDDDIKEEITEYEKRELQALIDEMNGVKG